MEESAGMFVTHIKEQRESISGVSLDEEAADLINFQRAYEAAAEYISVIDELIGTLIDMVRS
jgi:flagellar hook-associated protein 1 FlgK